MTDVFTRKKRSEVMSHIRGRGNKETELALMKIMRRKGITGWRRKQSLFGNPDFVFRKERLVLFVDGCFWHGCPKHYQQPTNNQDFWKEKFQLNKKRDRLVNRTLHRAGWRVLRIWEHDLTRKNEVRCVRRIRYALTACS